MKSIRSLVFGLSLYPLAAIAAEATLETPRVRFTLSPDTGCYTVTDKRAKVTWHSNPNTPRFGEATLVVGGKPVSASLGACRVQKSGASLRAEFHPLPNQPKQAIRVTITAVREGDTLEFAYAAEAGTVVERIRLLDQALWMTEREQGYVAVPVREGLLIHADSGKAFAQTFDTYTYEGCHMAMIGIVKQGAAALLTWNDPYVAAEIKSELNRTNWSQSQQVLYPSLALRKSARSFRLQLLGPGDYVAIAKAYREVARRTGWLVTWDEKLKGHPERAKLLGAVNYKLWSTLSRSMNEESTQELSARVNWTFAEAAQIAEHLKNDLQLDKVLFLMGGWIKRGYDNQHPDILPAAPECGGNEAFADCSRRILRLGYVYGLHDNYQDIYRDSPSWNEDYIMKQPDGSLTKGGKWAGGRAYLTCSKMALELAKRPQNLPAVKALTGANAYFIDTTYAAGLCECFDPKHPLTRLDDMKWKQALSDYAREVFGIFGSECGREWAIPHSDFFEGFTGVSGTYYHNKDLAKNVGGTVVPLFELVYRDCIAMYGKYGYNNSQAAGYVLHHLLMGRPLHYHSVPSHLYWKTTEQAAALLALTPSVEAVKPTGARQFEISYRWKVEQPATGDWRVFVHFTDGPNNIKFQNDYAPPTPVAQWAVGDVKHGPFQVSVPPGLNGVFQVRMGLFDPARNTRAAITGAGSDQTVIVGKLTVKEDQITFEPAAPSPAIPNAAIFTLADGGWAEGMHSLDRFVKNTYEILSPLNEMTARQPMISHQFLSADRLVQRSTFAAGKELVTVTANNGATDHRCASALGGPLVLPPNGFLVESPQFVAFLARNWNGREYAAPVLFTLRSLDGKPLKSSGRIRVYHGFGDRRIQLGQRLVEVAKEAVVAGGK